MNDHPFDALSEASLRRRQSAKWTLFGADILPAWVAEMDFPLAEPIRRVLCQAIDDADAGYASSAGLGEVFAVWARERWGWSVAPGHVHLVADVVTGIAEILRVATLPGDGVLIEPPVYPAFAATIETIGRRVVSAPLSRTDLGWASDLNAIEDSYKSGARVHVLCSPQNPTGLVYPRETLEAIADLAEKHRVLVLADEIHAPLTLPGATHVPFPVVSDAARRRSIVLTSASKTWNIAGLKAAVMVASDETGDPHGPSAVLAKLPPETPYHAGHFGVIASKAAFLEGQAWLAQATAILDRNRSLLGALLKSELPAIGYLPPQASYLAWLDCRGLRLGVDPCQVFLTRGKVALSSGPTFGAEGEGFVRLNMGTSRGMLEEVVSRMRKALAP
ncbi:MAG: MalY/PatB family protein [Polyangiaceae bacterium]